jgi:PAS domain S-box-containing protein
MTIENRRVEERSGPMLLAVGGGDAMTSPSVGEAIIEIDAAGRYLDANSPALALLGVSLEDLRTSAPDRFAIRPTDESEQAALRAEWESDGSQPLVGTAGLKRADGTTIRVSYAIEPTPGGFRARLREVEGSPQAPPSVFSVGAVLRQWRAAERSLAELHPGSEEWARLQSEIDLLRAQYQELFRSVSPRGETGN